jgi:hypothetical protein
MDRGPFQQALDIFDYFACRDSEQLLCHSSVSCDWPLISPPLAIFSVSSVVGVSCFLIATSFMTASFMVIVRRSASEMICVPRDAKSAGPGLPIPVHRQSLAGRRTPHWPVIDRVTGYGLL